MKFSAPREVLLEPLQAVIGVVERRQTMPVLANVLIVARDGRLGVTATDLEVELVASTEVDVDKPGEITVPGRKFLDICRALPEGAQVSFAVSGDKATVRSGRSRFTLSTLPAAEFPTVEDIRAQQMLTLPQSSLRRLLEKTHFSMANQDVRYYLNGMLLEAGGSHLRAVATDGHRLALCQAALDGARLSEQQVIIPRKGVLELRRLLGGGEEVDIQLGENHVRIQIGGIRFTSKLIDGRFPEYERVIPKESKNELKADKEILRSALQRTAILSNEKYRGIRLIIRDSGVVLQAHNPEQEEAEEEVAVEYAGDDIEIGFNVTYLLDAIGAVDGAEVTLSVVDSNSSCLVRQPGNDDKKFVVMPMRL
jgi:DNA polymerase-3 subunit beta